MANTLKYLNHLMQNSGITPACSEEEHQAAEQIAEVFRNHGFDPEIQEFNAATFTKLPHVFIGVLLFVGAVLMGVGGALGVIGLLLLIAAAAWFFLERLGRTGSALRGSVGLSQNVIAYHKAEGPLASPRNRPVVIVAHYDSPRADLLSRAALAPLRPWLVKLMPFACAAPVVLGILNLFPFPGALHVMFWLLAIVCSVLPLFNAVCIVLNKFVLPYTSGAVCNKSSVAAMLGVMDAVAPYRGENEFPNDIPADQYAATYQEPAEPGEIPYGPVETYQGGASAATASEAYSASAPAFRASDQAVVQPDATVSMPAVGTAQEGQGAAEDANATVAMDMSSVLPAQDQVSVAAEDDVLAEAAPAAAFDKIQGDAGMVDGIAGDADDDGDEAPAAVRHGERVIRQLRMLPDTCAITYIYERPRRKARRVSVPAVTEPAVSQTPEQGASPAAAPARVAQPTPAMSAAAQSAPVAQPAQQAPIAAAPEVPQPTPQPVPQVAASRSVAAAPVEVAPLMPAAAPSSYSRPAQPVPAPAAPQPVAPQSASQPAAQVRTADEASSAAAKPAGATAVMNIPPISAETAPAPVTLPEPQPYAEERTAYAPVRAEGASQAHARGNREVPASPAPHAEAVVSRREAEAPIAPPAASSVDQASQPGSASEHQVFETEVARPSLAAELGTDAHGEIADDAVAAVRAAQAASAHVELADQVAEDAFSLPEISTEPYDVAPFAESFGDVSGHAGQEVSTSAEAAAPAPSPAYTEPMVGSASEDAVAARENEDAEALPASDSAAEPEEDSMPTSAWRVTSDPAFGWEDVAAADQDSPEEAAEPNPYQTAVFNPEEIDRESSVYADADPIPLRFRLFPEDDKVEVAEAIIDGVVEEEPPAEEEPSAEAEGDDLGESAQAQADASSRADCDEIAAAAEPAPADVDDSGDSEVEGSEAFGDEAPTETPDSQEEVGEPEVADEPLEEMIDLVAPPAHAETAAQPVDQEPGYFEETYAYEEDAEWAEDEADAPYASDAYDDTPHVGAADAAADEGGAYVPAADIADSAYGEYVASEDDVDAGLGDANAELPAENAPVLDKTQSFVPSAVTESAESEGESGSSEAPASNGGRNAAPEATQAFSATQMREAQDAAVDAMMAEIDPKFDAARSSNGVVARSASAMGGAKNVRTQKDTAMPPSLRASLIDLPDPSAAPYDPLGTGSIPVINADAAEQIQGAEPSDQSGHGLRKGLSGIKLPKIGGRAKEGDARNRVEDAPAEDVRDSHPQKKHQLHGLFDLLKRRKKDDEGGSMSEWLGVSDDFDAKTSGREIGSWDNFEDDSGSWKGGAASDGTLSEEEVADAVASLGDDELLGHDIWFVATGASVHGGAGMQAFLDEHRDKLRGVFLINLECVGAGETSVVMREGTSRPLKGDRRISGLLNQVSADFHTPFSSVDMPFVETDATVAMGLSLRSITVAGVDPAGPRFACAYCEEDAPYQVDPQKVETVANVVTEVIRRS